MNGSSNIVRLGVHKTDGVIAALEDALARARAGQIDGYAMVETGYDGKIAGKVQVRLSLHTSKIEEVSDMLALAGGMDFVKNDVLSSMDT